MDPILDLIALEGDPRPRRSLAASRSRASRVETLESGTAGYVEGLDFGRRQGAVVDVRFFDHAKELVLYVMGIGTDCASDRIPDDATVPNPAEPPQFVSISWCLRAACMTYPQYFQLTPSPGVAR